MVAALLCTTHSAGPAGRVGAGWGSATRRGDSAHLPFVSPPHTHPLFPNTVLPSPPSTLPSCRNITFSEIFTHLKLLKRGRNDQTGAKMPWGEKQTLQQLTAWESQLCWQSTPRGSLRSGGCLCLPLQKTEREIILVLSTSSPLSHPPFFILS